MSQGLGGEAPPSLWPHQVQAIEATQALLASGGRCQVVMACGTGKTRVGAEVSVRLAPAGKILVVVPTLELLSQTARAYAAILGSGAGLLGAVCSEQSALSGAAPGELAYLRAGVTQDPAEIGNWLRAASRVTVFTTYQSLETVAEASRAAGTRWDLVVVDEAHRAAGVVGRKWGLIHDNERLPAARRLYMTATPRILAAEKHDVTSMDDERTFGPEAYHLSFATAINEALLADYRVAVIVITDAEIAKLTAAASVSTGGLAVPAGMLAQQVALLKACARWSLQTVITYHGRIARSARFSQTLLNAADLLSEEERPRLLHAAHIDGGTVAGQRQHVLRRLARPGTHTVIVSNAQVLAQGVDVPELDAVMFADPRDSSTDIVQAVGRALRKGGRDKKTATLIVPLLLTEGESPEAALEGSAFDMVWRVIRGLRAHDERLADWLDQRRIANLRTHDQKRAAEPPPWLDIAGTPITPAFASAVEVRMLQATSPSWLDGYARAARWHQEHGDLLIPSDCTDEDGFRLGEWIRHQRQHRKKGFLAADRIAKLDEIHMTWDAFDAAWEEGFTRARDYREQHGNLLVSRDYACPDGYPLGAWIHTQRYREATGQLSASRVARLAGLGHARRARKGPDSARWQNAVSLLRAYKAEFSTADVPLRYITPSGFTLGRWVARQRLSYRKGTLPPEGAQLLTEIGVTWKIRSGWSPDRRNREQPSPSPQPGDGLVS